MGLVRSGTLRAGFIVWTENGSIFRANLDGSDRHQIFRASSSTGAATGLAYDSVTGLLYWDGRTEPSSVNVGRGIVRRMNLDGSNSKTLIDSGMGTTTYGFTISHNLRRIYIGEHKALRYADLDGTGLTTLPIQPLYDGVIRVDEANRRIYFTEGVIYYGIRRANLDGSGLENVYRGWTACFDLSFSENKIYVGTNKDIRRVDFDGSHPQVLIPNAEHLISLQLDVSGKTMYWMTNTHIDCANLDGSNPRPIIRRGATATLAKDDMIIITSPANLPATELNSKAVNY
jgi:hypothetical protein